MFDQNTNLNANLCRLTFQSTFVTQKQVSWQFLSKWTIIVSVSVLFSSLPIGAFEWPITSSVTLIFNLNFAAIGIYFSSCVYPNPPCQLPCERKPECPEKTHE